MGCHRSLFLALFKNKIKEYVFFMSSKHVLNVNVYINDTFFTSIYLITYVLRWFQVRVWILHFTFMNHFARYVSTNYSIYIF